MNKLIASFIIASFIAAPAAMAQPSSVSDDALEALTGKPSSYNTLYDRAADPGHPIAKLRPESDAVKEDDAFFHREGREGWFWYKDELLDPETETEKATEPDSQAPKPEEQAKEPERKPIVIGTTLDDGKPYDPEFDGFKIDWAGVWEMHPAKFREMLQKTLDWAIWKPTPARVQRYYALQYVAKERALRFQEAFDYVRNQNPVMDPTAADSATMVGTNMNVLHKTKSKQDTLPKIRENMGLFFFYTPKNCLYCERQQPILEAFSKKWEWSNIMMVDVTNRQDLVKEYRLQVLPDLWAIGKMPDGEIKKTRIKAGLSTVGQMEDGIMNSWSMFESGDIYRGQDMVKKLTTFEDIAKKMQEEGGIMGELPDGTLAPSSVK